MKTILYCLLSVLAPGVALGQAGRIDSIRYNKGYLLYHEYGHGKPVIVLSGGPGISYQRGERMAQLLAKKYRAILLEQRGTGHSLPVPLDSTTINLREAQADINRLLAHLKLKKATIVGHSWGGMLALSYACAFPQKIQALVLVATGPIKLSDGQAQVVQDNRNVRLSQKEQDEQQALKAKKPRTRADDIRLQQLDMLANLYDKRTLDSLFVDINAGQFNVRTNSLMSADLFRTKFDLTQCLPTLNCPVYLICGRQDPVAFVTYELKALLPQASLYWISHCGHFPMYEQPGQFTDILTGIMSKPTS